MDVDARIAEVAKRELRQRLQRVVWTRRTGANTLEELAEIVTKPCHRAIVR
jgi:hypothetical protein